MPRGGAQALPRVPPLAPSPLTQRGGGALVTVHRFVLTPFCMRHQKNNKTNDGQAFQRRFSPRRPVRMPVRTGHRGCQRRRGAARRTGGRRGRVWSRERRRLFGFVFLGGSLFCFSALCCLLERGAAVIVSCWTLLPRIAIGSCVCLPPESQSRGLSCWWGADGVRSRGTTYHATLVRV